MTEQSATTTSKGAGKTRAYGRLGLFLPYVALAVLAALWSGGWIWARNRAAAEMDAWVAREAAAGRTWSCTDRTITGYPFRIELRCAALSLARADGGFTLGPVTAVVQVYDPRHVIVQASGPFHTTQGALTGDATWRGLQASFHGTATGFTRADLVVDDAQGRVVGAGPDPIDFAMQHLELHGRPSPGRFESQGAVDVSLQARQTALPALDALTGSDEPADIALDATLERATGIGTRALPVELERWRRADGRLDVTLLSVAKAAQRLRAKGEVGLDEAHRPAGAFEVRTAGLESLVGRIMGARLGAERGALIGNLVGQFLGGLQRRAPTEPADSPAGAEALKTLPPLRLAEGRLMLGPLPIPNVALPSLY